ncbi:MAG: hypothetical protein EP330_21735 [Deltaproteobacteria bacterium]|nr:MAG: hypothetical protein EP330_21735 [Deltaproteobacteria bacterium]
MPAKQTQAPKKKDSSDEVSLASISKQVVEQSNDEQQEKLGKTSFLSETWQGVKQGASIGGGLGSAPGLLLAGAGAGLADKAGGGKKSKIGGGLLGGIIAGAGALAGGLVGGLGGLAVRGIDQLRGGDKREQRILEATAAIPAYHVIMEQLAHTYAYGKGDEKTLASWGYEIAHSYEDSSSGFRVVAFSPMSKDAKDPDGKPLQPAVAFRGTANLGGGLDDANDQGIGTFQFGRNEKEIEQTLKAAGSTADVTGHSLGGALAQLAAARFGSMVGNIVTFQSPGINADEAAKIDPKKHEATHYRAAGDVVSDAGAAHAQGKVFSFRHKGMNSPLSHMTFPLAELNALRKKHNFNDVPAVDGARSGDDQFLFNRRETGEKNWRGKKEYEHDHHDGEWATKNDKTVSRLFDVDESTTDSAKESFLVRMVGGRGTSEGTRKLAGNVTGITDRQKGYAAAWGAIRDLVKTVTSPEHIDSVRQQVVALCIKFEVEVRDHAKFISQAEAFMLSMLEQSPNNMDGSTATT